MQNANDKTQNDIDNTQGQIDQALQDINKVTLAYFEFLHADNPYQLVEDVKCEIAGDSVVCWVPNIMPNKVLIPQFSYQGKSLTIGGKAVESGVTSIDFGKPQKLTVTSDLLSKDYTVYVYSYTGLPMVWLTTNNREDISVSDLVYEAKLKIVENARTRGAGDVIEANARLKAIGPLSWVSSKLDGSSQMGKNNYRFTINAAYSVLDDPMNTTWELLSNAKDATMLHTQTGFHLGKISNLHFTPHFHFADLMLNERYFGTYLLGESIDYTNNRTGVESNGFIVKIDASNGRTYFKTDNLEQPVTIVSPTVFSGDEDYQFISNYVRSAESALFGSNFTDATEGWQRYLDMDSFVDWYLINEIAKNLDGDFGAECYMNMKRDGKLRMGPLWKMERSFGYGDSSTSDFVIKNVKWYNRLFQDPAFVAKVKERFTYFYNHKNDILKEIDADVSYLRNAIPENNNKWEVFSGSSADDVRKKYQKEVTTMKSWIEKRMEWLNDEISKL
ncbi:CotH kinase family protein [Prevotella sp. ne3005]|uniref:CotH kinase family protein n=1 Tax=Prevotella sp. ne3005 TaxID=1761887 RepID=UPI00147C54EE|nr:CotH kinase family protein [Prevotella sp. ne3005]